MSGPLSVAHAGGISGFTSVTGNSTLSRPNATTTVITQSGSKAINTFQNLSVPTGDTLIFREPSRDSVSLNRVLGGSASQIDGVVQANGNVWIVNPNGVFFGAGAQVNVGGLVATTSDIRDRDFLAGTGSYAFAIAPHDQ